MRKTVLISLLILLATIFASGVVMAEREVIFCRKDAKGDDYGAGKLNYPAHEVFIPGLFDLEEFSVETDPEFVYFNFKFSLITNPFQAPEGFFHQRIELLIDSDPGGNGEISFGKYRLQTSPDHGWEIKLSVIPFGESFLVVEREGERRSSSEGILSRVLADGKTISVQVERSLLPKPDKSWQYYVLVGSFDGLAQGFLRDFGASSWQPTGEGVPVFDLLAPRWGSKNQKRQLTQRVLVPVGPQPVRLKNYVLISMVLLFLGSILFLWRWKYGGA